MDILRAFEREGGAAQAVEERGSKGGIEGRLQPGFGLKLAQAIANGGLKREIFVTPEAVKRLQVLTIERLHALGAFGLVNAGGDQGFVRPTSKQLVAAFTVENDSGFLAGGLVEEKEGHGYAVAKGQIEGFDRGRQGLLNSAGGGAHFDDRNLEPPGDSLGVGKFGDAAIAEVEGVGARFDASTDERCRHDRGIDAAGQKHAHGFVGQIGNPTGDRRFEQPLQLGDRLFFVVDAIGCFAPFQRPVGLGLGEGAGWVALPDDLGARGHGEDTGYGGKRRRNVGKATVAVEGGKVNLCGICEGQQQLQVRSEPDGLPNLRPVERDAPEEVPAESELG